MPLLAELDICLVVPVSINISPLTGLESLKLIPEWINQVLPTNLMAKMQMRPPSMIYYRAYSLSF
jgi:hypothetical protein